LMPIEIAGPYQGRHCVKLRESTDVLSAQLDLFLTDEQARQLAEAILTALYPETAALAEAHAEHVQ